MPNTSKYHWFSCENDSTLKPTIAFIAPSSYFPGDAAKDRIKLLVQSGFKVIFPVFGVELQSDVTEVDLNALDILDNLVVEPEIEGRINPTSPTAIASPALSPAICAEMINYCLENSLNIMPFMGGNHFQDAVLHLINNPHKKNLDVKIYGYSNSSWANILMMEGICTYVPTQFTNHFVRREEFKDLKVVEDLSEEQSKLITYLEFVAGQADKLEEFLKDGVIGKSRRKILSSVNLEENTAGVVMHYPLNADVVTGLHDHPERFNFNPRKDVNWSCGIEWMMQRAKNFAKSSEVPDLLAEILEKNKEHPPKFVEVGCLGTRLDGFNGIGDLIHDEETGDITVDSRNASRILTRKESFVAALNKSIEGFLDLEDNSSREQYEELLPEFLKQKLLNNQIFEIDEVSESEVLQVLEWQNKVQDRVIKDLQEITDFYQVPLIQNPRFGHVANMEPGLSGLCQYSVQGNQLYLESGNGKNNKRSAGEAFGEPASSVITSDNKVYEVIKGGEVNKR